MLRPALLQLAATAAARSCAPASRCPAWARAWASSAASSGGVRDGDGGGGGGDAPPGGHGGGRMAAISIDRSGLFNPPEAPSGESQAAQHSVEKEPETAMAKHVKAMVQFRGGPLTMAEYMKEVLTNPIAGFYMGEQVIGSAGDFVTSPEISQMFGEMVGIWAVCTWQQMGCPEQLRLVELGPGKGTLMADLLRGTRPFAPFQRALDVRLVEVSTGLRHAQWRALQCGGADGQAAREMPEGATGGASPLTAAPGGTPVAWHTSLGEVPRGVPTIYIAHEFLDALPVHQFQRAEGGKWVERLVDVASPDSPLHLRFVLAPRDTPARQLLLDRRLKYLGADATKYDEIEVGGATMSVASELAQRVSHEGGAALLVDYGQDAPYPSSVQGIKNHKLVGVLESPGEVDLSAWVDFSSVRQAVAQEGGGAAVTHGPITQAHFLRSLGIDARLESLLQHASPKQAGRLKQGYARLVGSSGEGGLRDGMGATYKAMVIAHQELPTPVAFEPVEEEGEEEEEEEEEEPAPPSGSPNPPPEGPGPSTV